MQRFAIPTTTAASNIWHGGFAYAYPAPPNDKTNNDLSTLATLTASR